MNEIPVLANTLSPSDQSSRPSCKYDRDARFTGTAQCELLNKEGIQHHVERVARIARDLSVRPHDVAQALSGGPDLSSRLEKACEKYIAQVVPLMFRATTFGRAHSLIRSARA